MALGIQTEISGGDFLPIVKYDARAGRWFQVDREQLGDGTWDKSQTEISQASVKFAMDLANIHVGWISFDPVVDFKLVTLGAPLPAKPSDAYKQGFRMKIFNKQIGIREFSHTAKCVLQSIDKLHDAYQAAGQPAGKLPIVAFTGTQLFETKGPKGTTSNYGPVLEIQGWIDRPADWPSETIASVKATASVAPPATPPAAQQPANHVAHPAAQPAAQPVANGEFF